MRPLPLRILAAPGQWPLLPQKAVLALQSASVVLWQVGADPSLLAMLGPGQRQCELSPALEVPSILRSSKAPGQGLVLLQAPDAAAPRWDPDLPSFETIRVASPPPLSTQVILTRAHEHNLDIAKALNQANLGSLSLPSLAFGPAPDPELVTRTLAQLAGFFGVIVSSPRGVRALKHAPVLPATAKIAAVGASTQAALLDHQLPCHLTPKLPHSEGLVDALKARGWLAKHWLHLRGDTGRDVLQKAIEAAQGQYTLLPCYQSLKPQLSRPLLRASQDAHLRLICFASGQSYLNYKQLLRGLLCETELEAHLNGLQILSFGPVTSKAIRNGGHKVAIELAQPSAEHQLEAILATLSRD